MTLFDGKPMELTNKPHKPKKPEHIILCASRMTDMPKFYPEELIDEVEGRLQKGEKIHTLILLTKHPRALLKDPLYSYLLGLKQRNIQLFLQLTITGLGGLTIGKKANGKPLILESNTPPYKDSLEILPQVIQLLGKPARIRLRFDPVVRIKDINGREFSNLRFLPEILEDVSKLGVTEVSFSLLEKNLYQKVEGRFKAMGCSIIKTTEKERSTLGIWLKELEDKYGVRIHACCVPGFPDSKCVDGEVLASLHDEIIPVNLTQQRKREKCACTHTIDVGGWPPKTCYSGCEYCYAKARYYD
jgi:hypothetical protein